MKGPGVWQVAVLSAGLATLIVVSNVNKIDTDLVRVGTPYVALYDHPETPYEVIVNQGDGQSFAALAQDPLLRRPEVFRGEAPEATYAYRAQRPLLGWLTWLISAGQAPLVPIVLVAMAAAGFAALGATIAWSLERRGSAPGWALAVLVTPGATVTLDWTGPECLGAGVAVLAVGLWSDGRRRWALAAMIAACLCRETFLLVPVALAAHGLVVDREPPRRMMPLAIPIAVYVAWVGVVWARLGALPTDTYDDGRGRLSWPLLGLVDAAGRWDARNMASAALILGAGCLAAYLGRRDAAGWVAGAFVLASLVFGPDVWKRQEDFLRVLVPVAAFAAIIIVQWRADERRDAIVA